MIGDERIQMSVGETPQCANDSHASLPTAWQTTSLTGPAARTGCHYRGQRKTNIYPGKWFSGERLLMQTQELHSGSRGWCSPLPWHHSDLLIPLFHCVLRSNDWLLLLKPCHEYKKPQREASGLHATDKDRQTVLTCLHGDHVKVPFNSIAVLHLLWHQW